MVRVGNSTLAHGVRMQLRERADEVAATKRILGFDPDVSFPAEDDVVAHARLVGERGNGRGNTPVMSSAPSTAGPKGGCLTPRF